MDKKILNIITLVAFVLCGTNAAFALDEDGFEVQSLSVDNSIEQENTSTINMTKKKFPKQEEKQKEPENSYVLTPENVYPQYNPYAYNTNYIQYKKVIGPYYTTGFNRGFGFNYKGYGYNYKGHGYNYGYSTLNNNPIYVTTPPPPPPTIHPTMHKHSPHHHNHHKPHHQR